MSITPRMVEALRVVAEHLEQHQRPPTVAEVGELMSPPVSPARAGQLLDALVDAGRLERDRGVARGLRLPRPRRASTTAPES